MIISYSRILIGSRLRSIRGQTHDYRHYKKDNILGKYKVKSCRSIEKVREAGRSKKKPFLFFENDSERILSGLTKHKIGVVFTSNLTNPIKKNVCYINLG